MASTSTTTVEHLPSRRQLALTAGGWGIVSCFPWAALVGWVYRFPVPFVGYLSGADAVLPALAAVLVYGCLLGGFLVTGGLAALAGSQVSRLVTASQSRLVAARCCGLLAGLAAVSLLAVLDKLIGRW